MANKIYYTMGINMNIEYKLREARKQLGFSQEYVANCLGISMTALAQIERGNRDVSVKEVAEFVKYTIYQPIVFLKMLIMNIIKMYSLTNLKL